MAGMLPGVESARRRRCRGSDLSSIFNPGTGSGRIRFSCDTFISSPSILHRSMANQSGEDEKLGGSAREAKERLDGRLRGHRQSQLKRQNSQERLRGGNVVKSIERSPSSAMVMRDLQMEVLRSKKSGTKRFSWGKMKLIWKSSSQDECAICLDQFKARENISRLPCAHRFHSNCLLPWLESSAHCPCCRAGILRSS